MNKKSTFVDAVDEIYINLFMGIDSLLKVLKSISKKKHISDYKN